MTGPFPNDGDFFYCKNRQAIVRCVERHWGHYDFDFPFSDMPKFTLCVGEERGLVRLRNEMEILARVAWLEDRRLKQERKRESRRSSR